MLVLYFLLAGWQVCGGQSVWASRLCSDVTASYLCDKCWPSSSSPPVLVSLWQPAVRGGFSLVVTGFHGGLAIKYVVKSVCLLLCCWLHGEVLVLKLQCIHVITKSKICFKCGCTLSFLQHKYAPLTTYQAAASVILWWGFDVFLEIWMVILVVFVFLSGCHKWLCCFT